MKVNKKLFVIIPVIVAILLFVGLYIYFNSEDSNSFSASERRWLDSNKNRVENIEVIGQFFEEPPVNLAVESPLK